MTSLFEKRLCEKLKRAARIAHIVERAKQETTIGRAPNRPLSLDDRRRLERTDPVYLARE